MNSRFCLPPELAERAHHVHANCATAAGVLENSTFKLSQDWLAELKSGHVIRVHHEKLSDGGWVSTHEDITEHRNAERQIAHLALHDSLTELPNRAAQNRKLDGLLKQHGVEGSQFAVLYLDLDRFKEVNDLFGHNIGDVVLLTAAKRLCVAADSAFVARFGGDEFMVLAEVDAASAAVLADRIIATLSA